MFLRHKGNFSDVSLISGVDDIADGRSFALLDFNQDGWQDIAMMSLNAPRFKLYRNELKTIYPENSSFRFRLIGGQRSGTASANLSNRDGIGATALITFASGNKLFVQRQAGEGFASQNSDVKIIVLDVIGNNVGSFSTSQNKGEYSLHLNDIVSHFNSGIYFVNLQVNNTLSVKKVVCYK